MRGVYAQAIAVQPCPILSHAKQGVAVRLLRHRLAFVLKCFVLKHRWLDDPFWFPMFLNGDTFRYSVYIVCDA